MDDGKSWDRVNTTFHHMPKHLKNVLSILKPQSARAL